MSYKELSRFATYDIAELTFQRITVGKIYAGLLIAENWKAFKANKTSGGPARMVCKFSCEPKVHRSYCGFSA
jgi:hypothetical protein